MIYEIFNAVDGKTQGFRCGISRTTETIRKFDAINIPGYVVDYVPAREGFYVIDMRECVKAGPFQTRDEAQRNADWENQCNDFNSFSVVKQELN
jgi:hypothetical protein